MATCVCVRFMLDVGEIYVERCMVVCVSVSMDVACVGCWGYIYISKGMMELIT